MDIIGEMYYGFSKVIFWQLHLICLAISGA